MGWGRPSPVRRPRDDPPAVELTFEQRNLDAALGGLRLRRAIVVPNSRLAYLARLAFGEGEYRVVYNDMIAAVNC